MIKSMNFGQISLNNQWKDRKILNFKNSRMAKNSGAANVGMKGSKLPMNSQFRKMHTILKQRGANSSA